MHFNRFILPAAASMLLVASVSCSQGEKTARLSDSELAAQFADPSNDWRGKPFWSWNGKLEKDELIRQVGVMKDMGFGGYFMHSRVGLATEYLGEEWFDLINAVADAGEQEGMVNYLYDEDRWPSGTAGGYVTMKPEYRLHKMMMTSFPKSADMVLADTLAAVFTCNLDGNSFSDLQKVATVDEAMASKGETVLAFYIQESERSNFYNGYTMADEMNREATDYYISLTHEAYKKNCGDRLGNSISGIFTDEPHRGLIFNNEASISWTAKMPEEYASRFGGDIIADLPYIFLHPEGRTYDKAKWKYVELAQELFLENFVKPQADWCKANGIAYTGHFLHEECLSAQVMCQGSLMRDYEYQDIPGIDNLTQYWRSYWVGKQISSVAHQTGKKRILSELYGCSGWQMSFEDYKEAGDWEALFGINLRCPHLSWYTMKGEAKRDYPASINFQSGWYKDFKYVEDYYARLGLLIAQGQPACDLLVINPIESVFAQVSVDAFNGLTPRSESMHRIEGRYKDLFNWIQGSHFDFDYGDEAIMDHLASVSKQGGVPVLKVGEMAYKAVLVGNMATMRSSTLALLKKFAAAGGKIILAGEAPSMVDVEESDEASSFLAQNALATDYTREGVEKALEATISRMANVTVAGKSGEESRILCQVRKDADRMTYVFMSMDMNNAINGVDITLPAAGEVSLWDCRTGKVTALGNSSDKGETKVSVDFPPLQEYVYVVTDQPVGEPAVEAAASEFKTADAQGLYEYALNEPNVLPLDMVTFKAEGLNVTKETEILKADRMIRKNFGLNYRGGDMLQPWFFKKFIGDSKPSYGPVELAYSFNIGVMPKSDIFLCIEGAEDFKVFVNGSEISTETAAWWIDPCYSKVALDKSMLKVGKNVITLATDFTEDKNLEAMYIVGDFGVGLSGEKTVITTLPEKLALGDVMTQGLPFYSGVVSYNFGDVKASKVQAPDFGGACLKVRRGEQSNMVAFAPYVQDVPQGDGDLWFDVVLTRRNTFGPLHVVPAKTYSVGPETFVTQGASFSDSYSTLPAGLLKLPAFAE